MKKIPKFILLLIVVAIGFGVYWFKMRKPSANEDFKLYGNVEIREAEVAFRQSGRIKQIFVDEGATVKQGDLLATLDSDTFEQAIATASADISVATAEVKKLTNGSRPEEISLAEANVRQAEAQYKNALEEFNRQSSLLPSGSVSGKIVDNARTARDVAKANFDAATSNLKLKRNGARAEDIESGRGRLAAANANRSRLEIALDDTQLVAPADGIIISRTKEEGAMVTPQNTIFTISKTRPVYVRAYVPEYLLGRVSPGSLVNLKTDSNNKNYHGRVGFVSPRSEFTPKNVESEDLRTDLVYRIRILVTDPDNMLLQGMPVTVDVPPTNAQNQEPK